jgi:hypothetical protein
MRALHRCGQIGDTVPLICGLSEIPPATFMQAVSGSREKLAWFVWMMYRLSHGIDPQSRLKGNAYKYRLIAFRKVS